MAEITVFIGGVDRSENVSRDDRMNYGRDINGQGNASLVYADTPDGFVPDDGMEVLIKEDGVDRFGGIINGRPRGFRGPDSPNQLTFYQIDVASWEQRLNNRPVYRIYEDVLFETIVADLNTDFLSGEGVTLSVAAGTLLSVTFNGESVAECMDILCQLENDGRSWFVTPARVLTVTLQATTPAPVELNARNLELNNPRPTIEPDRTGYANRVTVVGGNPELPILYTAEDTGEIAARAALELSGSGIYHITVEDNSLKTAAQVQNKAEGILDQRKKIRQKFVGMTAESGFDIGQHATIDLPNLDIQTTQLFFIIGIETVVSPGVNELWHTITAIEGPIDGSWQSEYRRKRPPRTIPMQIEATPGLVRVLPEPGVLIHDPPPEPAKWFQGAKSGTLTGAVGVVALGITNESERGQGFVIQVGRGPVATPRQSHLELFPIDVNDKPAVTPSVIKTWDELKASSFKATAITKPDNTLCCVVERDTGGGDPTFIVLSLSTGLLGSVAAVGMIDNNNATEGAWVGDFVYWPETTSGSIFVFDVSDPANPTLDNEFATGLAFVDSCVPNRAGTFLYAIGSGTDLIAIDISDPTAPSVTDTEVLTGSYTSLDIDDKDARLVMFQRASSTTIRSAVVDVALGVLTLNTETTLTLATSAMAGVAVMFFDDSALCFSHRPPSSPANSFAAHNFTVLGGTVAFVETLSFTHGITGNKGPTRSYIGNRAVANFVFNTDLQITFGKKQFDKIVPYEIEKPLREEFGGTGINGETYIKGDLIVAAGQADLDRLQIGAGSGGYLRTRTSETVGMRWERDLNLLVAAITSADSPFTVPLGVTVVLADATAGAITVIPPAVSASFERLLIVKNDGDGTNAVTINPPGVETIDGALTLVLAVADHAVGLLASVNEWERLFEDLPTAKLHAEIMRRVSLGL